MKSTEFHPVHYDAHGRLRLPLLFWLVLLLQARTWVLFVIAGASREQGTALLNLFYPDHDNFWLGLIPGIVERYFTCFFAAAVCSDAN